MALYGYKPKTRPAPWTLQRPKIVGTRPERLRRVWTRKTNKSRSQTNLVRLRRTPINNPIRRMQLRQYAIEARAFVKELQRQGAVCPVWAAIPELRNARRYGHPTSPKITDVHHRFGRMGPLLLWKHGWTGLSRLGHRWVHQNIARARLHGWIAQKGDWNNLNVILRDQPT